MFKRFDNYTLAEIEKWSEECSANAPYQALEEQITKLKNLGEKYPCSSSSMERSNIRLRWQKAAIRDLVLSCLFLVGGLFLQFYTDYTVGSLLLLCVGAPFFIIYFFQRLICLRNLEEYNDLIADRYVALLEKLEIAKKELDISMEEWREKTIKFLGNAPKNVTVTFTMIFYPSR